MNKKKKRDTSIKKVRGVLGVNKKKTLVIVCLLFLIIAGITICNNSDKPILKSEYVIGEDGYLDDISIKLSDAVYINNDTGIEVTFTITNKRKETITMIPDNYFKFYDINQVQIPNKYTNDSNIIKKNETVNYKLQYDVTKKELYEIYFYSQIVENNVKFTFKSSDIRVNDLEGIDNTNIIESYDE